MTDSLSAFQQAISAFGDRLGDIRLAPLVIALALHLLSLLVRSGVWCGILRAAFPERAVPVRSAVWSYLAGVGANAVAPLRGGVVVVGIAAAAVGMGWLPPVLSLPDARAFELSLVVRHALAAGVVIGVILIAGGLTAE